jgi:hypothetical protein
MKKFALLAGLIFALAACQPSTQGIAENIKSRLQSRFDSEPEFKPYHLTVSEVDVIHEEGNRYRGLATVAMNATKHDVNLTILDDGEHGMYELEPGAFNFLQAARLASENPHRAGSDPCAANLSRDERLKRLASFGNVRQNGEQQFSAGNHSIMFSSVDHSLLYCD